MRMTPARRHPPRIHASLTAVYPPRTIRGRIGDVAQLGERCVRIAEVRGSNPLISTKSFQTEPLRQ